MIWPSTESYRRPIQNNHKLILALCICQVINFIVRRMQQEQKGNNIIIGCYQQLVCKCAPVLDSLATKLIIMASAMNLSLLLLCFLLLIRLSNSYQYHTSYTPGTRRFLLRTSDDSGVSPSARACSSIPSDAVYVHACMMIWIRRVVVLSSTYLHEDSVEFNHATWLFHVIFFPYVN